jgi:Cdc6-like AAA superfamily ATPase
VTLPAVGSALAGIDIFGHFERNAERYKSMSECLAKIADKIKRLSEQGSSAAEAYEALSSLQRRVRDADALMSHEQQGWRFVFGERLPGPG